MYRLATRFQCARSPLRTSLRTATTLGPTRTATKPATTATTASTSNAGAPTAGANFGGMVRGSNNAEAEAAAVWREFDDTPGNQLDQSHENWAFSFSGLGTEPFPAKVAAILNADAVAEDIEITPDGLLYLPEIKYRRILNKAFGPGGWGLAPRSPTVITPKTVSREYGLVCHGRLVAVARGEQQYFNPDGVPTAIEGCKSNALMRCCKDLGIASELWDPRFIRTFKKSHCDDKWFEKKRRFVWKRKDSPWEYPYK